MRRTGDDECRDVLVLMVGAIWWQGAVLSVFVRGGGLFANHSNTNNYCNNLLFKNPIAVLVKHCNY